MDADEISRWEAELTRFLSGFGDCFGRKNTFSHLGVYVRGQLHVTDHDSSEFGLWSIVSASEAAPTVSGQR
jgi:hypothetical protein